MEKRLKTKLDAYVGRQKKNFDHLIIVDGDEGYGKSTWITEPCEYIAKVTGKQWSVNNIFFDLDELMKFASTTEKQIIVWDEAAMGGMGIQWQNKMQQKLIMCLMVARKKRHFWFFIIPKFFKLKDYIIERSIALVHVYSRDDVTRGRYVFFSKKKKNQLYSTYQRTKKPNYKKYSFRGTFTKDMWGIDEDAYDKKKDEAIRKAFADDQEGGDNKRAILWKMRLARVSQHLKESKIMSYRELAKISGIHHYEISRIIKEFNEKQANPLEKGVGTGTWHKITTQRGGPHA